MKWVWGATHATNKRTREWFIAAWRIVTYFATWTRLRIARRALRPSWSRSLPRHWRGPRQTTPRPVMTTRRRRIYTQMTVYSDFRYTARIHIIQEEKTDFRLRLFSFWGVGFGRWVWDFVIVEDWVWINFFRWCGWRINDNLCLLSGWMSVWTVTL